MIPSNTDKSIECLTWLYERVAGLKKSHQDLPTFAECNKKFQLGLSFSKSSDFVIP